MKKALWIIPLILITLVFSSCDKRHPTQPDTQTGNLPIMMNLEPAFQQGFDVTRVNVVITKGDFTDDMDMAIDSTTASGTFEELEIGTYAINVSIFDDTLMIATGQGTATVNPGQTTTVHITLHFVPGGLEIIVDWGLPYEDCRRVLFVGNSHTYFNDGVYTHLQSLLDEVHPEWDTVIQGCTAGGYTLENHYNDLNTMSTIATGNWDLVIMQEQSSRPMNDPDLFYYYATALDSVITHNGALTGFYMTWAWRNNPEMYVPIRDAYNYIGAFLDAIVNPVGVAFYNNSQAAHGIDLYNVDNYHPNINGTYLASCVMLANIWNINPMGIVYHPDTMDSNTAAYIQELAWTTVQGYRQDKQQGILEKLEHKVPKSMQDTPESLFQIAS